MEGGRACYNNPFELTCWYPEVTVPGRYLVQTPGWKVNDSLLTLDGTTYQEQRLNSTATKVIVTVTDNFTVNTDVAYSCFLVLADTRLDESTQQVHVHIMGKWSCIIVMYYNKFSVLSGVLALMQNHSVL